MIHPTVGRVVWFYPNSRDDIQEPWDHAPLAAIVTRVWSDVLINVAAFDANGIHHARTSVVLEQDEVSAPPGESYCTWMPYQKGQAAKTEALEAQHQKQG